ncbi:MAG TPA: NUDIX hydrolase [Candidatus Paceibacterota bacterium]
MRIGIIVHTVVINSEGKFLLIKRASCEEHYPDLWDIPGGTLEPGEDPIEAAVREVKEESGLVVTDYELFAYTSKVDLAKNKQFLRLIFKARYKSGEVVLEPREHDDYRWIDPADVVNYRAVPYLPAVLKKLQYSLTPDSF